MESGRRLHPHPESTGQDGGAPSGPPSPTDFRSFLAGVPLRSYGFSHAEARETPTVRWMNSAHPTDGGSRARMHGSFPAKLCSAHPWGERAAGSGHEAFLNRRKPRWL